MLLKRTFSNGFNFIEMMTALGIAGILGVTGLNSYRKQRHQARTVQAQYSLSNIYAAEKNFKTQWKAYHENLYIIGAIPEGELWYDAGFTDTPVTVPHYPWQSKLTTAACNTYDQICNNDCANAVKGTYTASYYGGFTCKVKSSVKVKGQTGYGATATAFEALARAELNSLDEWTINEKQELTHKTDGTGN
ncbi:MAG: prepilin-type N-terminal cleavage/methylation domain-containing protein [Bdellovibrionales bacterium]|nr:prepilin-type N-terminal cleavage/methylation domain-containing protein [Bdellovibrionales bacterium]